eukprot:SAG31_NODE_30693_length_377_cov_0.931655_1_plen_44_part_10
MQKYSLWNLCALPLLLQEVIAINQDPAAMPMEPVSSIEGLEVWK